MTRTASTLTTWAGLLWDTLEAEGVDPKPLFREAGLDPTLLRESEARYPMPRMQRLWSLAAARMGSETFGLSVARRIRPTTFHALSFSWLASGTLREALERAERYFAIVSDGLLVRLGAPRAGTVALTLSSSRHGVAKLVPESMDAGAGALVMLCRMCDGPEWHPKGVRLLRAKPKAAAQFTEFFGAPIEWGAREAALLFDHSALNDPLPAANRELAIANDAVLKRLLARLVKDDIAGRVRGTLIERLPSGAVKQADIAKAIAMSERSLQRKLAEAGTNYQKLLDETRRDLGEAYVREGSRSITEIAYQLGFSDPANFTRAFRRWLGVAPRGLKKKR